MKYFLFLLSASWLLGGCSKETVIEVKTDFSYRVLDSNFTTPVRISFTNNTTGAENYLWTFEGGNPATSTKREPGTVQFDNAGNYKITLEAWNPDSRTRKEINFTLDSAVTIAFDTAVVINRFSPVQLQIRNQTRGGSTFNWTFQGGSPATSTLREPPLITFTDTGSHTIILSVSNGRRNFSLSKTLYVLPALKADFSIVPAFQNEDLEVPLTATLQNQTVSGLNWQWTASGGTISRPDQKSPTILFQNPGTYTVALTANNNKQTRQVSKTYTVFANRNLRTFSDIELGINTAHSTIGSFFSTTLRRKFTTNDRLDTLGKYIDIVYFGLNQNFTFNKFLSPDSAGRYTFADIPQAIHVDYINKLESCNCGINFTAADFDAMNTDAPIRNLNINANQIQFSNITVPRIVLFRTRDGRKGAIKIKRFVPAGQQSYIVVDIKVQKTP
jgi:PKD repeat protein